ncbi:hypothetical protein [Pseudooceanicola sp. LIPI14-2-Ac024]|uniref:hypothetical protein n=1 Tax=Pseudooceanicola sp. LIPI14-2-Ac024 TaxID=3344875 RepID=UPI0035CE932C
MHRQLGRAAQVGAGQRGKGRKVIGLCLQVGVEQHGALAARDLDVAAGGIAFAGDLEALDADRFVPGPGDAGLPGDLRAEGLGDRRVVRRETAGVEGHVAGKGRGRADGDGAVEAQRDLFGGVARHFEVGDHEGPVDLVARRRVITDVEGGCRDREVGAERQFDPPAVLRGDAAGDVERLGMAVGVDLGAAVQGQFRRREIEVVEA